MHAHVERLSHPAAIIRVGPDGWEYGQPYLASITLVFIDPPELVGLASTPTPEMWRAVSRALAGEGIPCAVYRRADGRKGKLRARA